MAIVCACMRAAFLSVIRSVVFRFMLAARGVVVVVVPTAGMWRERRRRVYTVSAIYACE